LKLKRAEEAFNTSEPFKTCCICTTEPADTAVIPCGHKSFCYTCINAYHEQYPQKGCPVCRGDIIMMTKIY
ncbi:MAG TPA: RING-HC finger protein, partial [Ferruginibacter sp.]|nr:RING-HC finger protein [Ferruginibacter sp.]